MGPADFPSDGVIPMDTRAQDVPKGFTGRPSNGVGQTDFSELVNPTGPAYGPSSDVAPAKNLGFSHPNCVISN